ncbi:hypothetical protein BKA65DRAFT_260837 [Rhexocercosporidium sp. MPI-PUGE-AT-0058]|nr:hypothetical protein BKA65DRAFT_260837 [Rhexocercosporidium sp. MPI-PUGE-AT-0058]
MPVLSSSGAFSPAPITERGHPSLNSSSSVATNISLVATEYAGWTVNSGGRGTIDIIWTCLIALVFCCWTSLHLNIPRPNEPSASRVFRKLRWSVIAIIFPEMPLTMAVVQRAKAWSILKQLKKADLCQDWGLRHGFFVAMGGFKIKSPGGWHVLKAKEFFKLLEAGKEPPNLSLIELHELSKSDGLGKAIAVFTGAWLLLTTIIRRIQNSPDTGNPRLPVSPLEVTSGIFVLNMLAAYMFWWEKPYDVQSSITWDVGDTGFEDLKLGDKRSTGRSRVKNLSSNRVFSLKYNGAFVLSCFVFSALHLLVLPAECYFPTKAEKWLWVGCSVAVAFTGLVVVIVSACVLIAMLTFGLFWYFFDLLIRDTKTTPAATESDRELSTDKLLGHQKTAAQGHVESQESLAMKEQEDGVVAQDKGRGKTRFQDWMEDLTLYSAFGFSFSPVLVLCLVRLTLLILALISLRELPAEIYATPHWESYLPFT